MFVVLQEGSDALCSRHETIGNELENKAKQEEAEWQDWRMWVLDDVTELPLLLSDFLR